MLKTEKLPRHILKEFLDEKVEKYQHPDFISSDPIQVPHKFSQKEDIEIAGFLAATIAWGNRKSIINNANRLMDIMGNSPYDFVMEYSQNDAYRFDGFVHRTFNATDASFFVESLQNIYTQHGGLENVFAKHGEESSLQKSISEFKKIFFSIDHPTRTMKHISDPEKNSAAKRINMFLRWMVRDGSKGVDFGIWNKINPSQLSCPLDVHSGNVARKLGLLTRKQNDAKALQELDNALRALDQDDPVKYDFALFGLGVFEKFSN
ncbi:TIGR02757 family protein [Pustulibacterium marinum]|uniref:TIGR02757 family protein n=1 Tax=Pustulibacterium marinum TaxID=1224947 RepID=A0A1I7ID17_9FLAO|nr:TIGR02757 family protein [Pustulibacterium marinum]SFU70863.1 TIGR02757 family protein [Pustulibacterium marinum]